MSKKAVTEELIENINSKFKHYYATQYDELCEVLNFAAEAHKGQKRQSGEDYFIHPLNVADILIDLGLESAAISAALLHDVVEDTDVKKEDIETRFGTEVAELVNALTKMERLQFKSKEEEQAENLRKMFFAMAKDIRVIIIKLADRLHNMRSLGFLEEERRIAMANETLEIYAPIAGRLGLSNFRYELEDLCLRYLHEDIYKELVKEVALKKVEREEIVERVISELSAKLSELEIKGEVSGRPKHFYSIYKKMVTKNKTFDQIYDLTAVRVIVESVKDCYEVLGTIHTMWKPVPDRFKDYIAVPKPNRYQSLHTTVVTDFGKPFEIQIRTYDMHRIAEYGIAAHWKYKEAITEKDSSRTEWIEQIVSVEGGLTDSIEFLSSVKKEFSLSTEVFVFTPKGDVIRMPANATALDFAYFIHTEVGNKCVGAKVNSKIVPLDFKMSTGDVVEVMTNANSKGPSRDWLKIVGTPSAKVKIKQFFKREMKEDNIKLGKEMCEKEAKIRGYSWSRIALKPALETIFARYMFTDINEMYASVGYGSIKTNQIMIKLIDYYKREVDNTLPPLKSAPVVHTTQKKRDQSVIVKGFDDLLVRFAKCCNPVPGDKIIGFISRGRGISVHRQDCAGLPSLETDRLIETEWASTINKQTFVASLHIVAQDKNGLIGGITKIISNQGISMQSLNARLDKNKNVVIDMDVNIARIEDMQVLIDILKRNKSIINVYRAT